MRSDHVALIQQAYEHLRWIPQGEREERGNRLLPLLVQALREATAQAEYPAVNLSTRPKCPTCQWPLIGEVSRRNVTNCPNCLHAWLLSPGLELVVA